ncbi:hypothetical protein ERO13_D13G157350v2 [Gossypium hirsutum]|nr:hypothetical protein ERO13_D13G157350v2 [Gossypium hirsutum]
MSGGSSRSSHYIDYRKLDRLESRRSTVTLFIRHIGSFG